MPLCNIFTNTFPALIYNTRKQDDVIKGLGDIVGWSLYIH